MRQFCAENASVRHQRSKYCCLHGLNDQDLMYHGECNLDTGGYFIINGSEKVRDIMTLNNQIPVRTRPN